MGISAFTKIGVIAVIVQLEYRLYELGKNLLTNQYNMKQVQVPNGKKQKDLCYNQKEVPRIELFYQRFIFASSVCFFIILLFLNIIYLVKTWLNFHFSWIDYRWINLLNGVYMFFYGGAGIVFLVILEIKIKKNKKD